MSGVKYILFVNCANAAGEQVLVWVTKILPVQTKVWFDFSFEKILDGSFLLKGVSWHSPQKIPPYQKKCVFSSQKESLHNKDAPHLFWDSFWEETAINFFF